MVPKRSKLLEDPPFASSSREEEKASGQEDEEGEKDEEEEKGKAGTAQESEINSDTHRYVKAMDYKTKRRQSNTASTPKPAAAAAAERGAETNGDAKPAKTKDGKKHFQWVWSKEDDIALMNEAIKYKESRGKDPLEDFDDFYDFIKKDLCIKVELGWGRDKPWGLKKKFKDNVRKAKGEEKRFGMAHKRKVFDLSKKIWGREGIIGRKREAESVVKSDGNGKGIGKRLAGEKKGKNVGVEMEKAGGFGKFHWTGGMEEYVLRKGMELLDGLRKDEMEEKLWKLHIEELELFIKKNELVRELLLAADNKMDED